MKQNTDLHAAAGEVVIDASMSFRNGMPFDGYGGSWLDDEAYSWKASCAPRLAYAVALEATESTAPPYTGRRGGIR